MSAFPGPDWEEVNLPWPTAPTLATTTYDAARPPRQMSRRVYCHRGTGQWHNPDTGLTVDASMMHADRAVATMLLLGMTTDEVERAFQRPDPPTLPERTASEPFVGWRCWRVVAEASPDGPTGYLLSSPVQGTDWKTPVLRDPKGPPPDPEPEWRDSLFGEGRWSYSHRGPGLYAHSTPDWGDWGSYRAMGRVELTGKVIVHEAGYRAEVCRITRLLLHPSVTPLAAPYLEERYQCPVDAVVPGWDEDEDDETPQRQEL